MKVAWDKDNLLKYRGSNSCSNIWQDKYFVTIITHCLIIIPLLQTKSDSTRMPRDGQTNNMD